MCPCTRCASAQPLFWLQASRIIRKALVVFPLRNATSAFSHSPLTPAEPANSPAPLSPHKLKSPPPPPPLAGSKGVFVLLPLQLSSPLAPALLPFELNKPAANNHRGWTQPFCFKFSTCQTSQSTKEKKEKLQNIDSCRRRSLACAQNQRKTRKILQTLTSQMGTLPLIIHDLPGKRFVIKTKTSKTCKTNSS